MYRLGVKELLEGFKDGSLTCEAYTTRVIRRAEELKTFNYFVSMDSDRMLSESRKADERYRNKTNRCLEGIPVAFKDNIDIEGDVTGAGTPGLAGLKPKCTADVAKRLFEAGVIHVGRTNMHELACGASSNNTFTGSCHNFHNFDYICGGSSGGSGGAVAADIVPVALGTDTGGSIRIPASYNGVFGFRPTIDHWPSNYGVKMTHLRDSVGPLARSAEDIAILESVMTGQDIADEPKPTEIRIGVPRHFFWEDLHPDVKKYAEQFLTHLKSSGFVIVEEGEIEGVGEIFRDYFLPTIDSETVPRLVEYLHFHGHDITAEEVLKQIASPDVKSIFRKILKTPISAECIESAMIAREVLIGESKRYFEEFRLDCILMPANKIPPPTLAAFDLDLGTDLVMRIVQNDDLACICDHPSLVIPGGFAKGSGVPFGMQIESLTGGDRCLLAVARAIERACEIKELTNVNSPWN